MKYFTPELLARYRSPDDDVAEAASQEWERATIEYKARLKAIRSRLPKEIRRFAAHHSLHDARILGLSFGRRRPRFSILLRLEGDQSRRGEVVELAYRPVTGEHGGVISRKHDQLGAGDQSKGWALYDEFNQDDERSFTHSLLLSDGHEIEVRFHHLHVRYLEDVFTPHEITETERHWPPVEA